MSNELEHLPQPAAPDWMAVPCFHADTTWSEKMGRVTNASLFLGACYAVATSTWIVPLTVSLVLTIRKIVAVVVGHLYYPVAITGWERTFNATKARLEVHRKISVLMQNHFHVKRITLIKSGISYDAYFIGHRDTINNGNWIVHALGNNGNVEDSLTSDVVNQDRVRHLNTVFINGPSAGFSGGYPTPYQLGAGIEAGLQFLEKKIKATKIVLEGYSMGGAMVNKAILAHDFTATAGRVNYLVISKCTFGKLSEVGADFVNFVIRPNWIFSTLINAVVKSFFTILNCDINNVEGSKKLSDLHIPHVIVQHTSEHQDGSDVAIADRFSLATKLKQEDVVREKTFLESQGVLHFNDLPQDIQERLDERVAQFLQ